MLGVPGNLLRFADMLISPLLRFASSAASTAARARLTRLTAQRTLLHGQQHDELLPSWWTGSPAAVLSFAEVCGLKLVCACHAVSCLVTSCHFTPLHMQVAAGTLASYSASKQAKVSADCTIFTREDKKATGNIEELRNPPVNPPPD